MTVALAVDAPGGQFVHSGGSAKPNAIGTHGSCFRSIPASHEITGTASANASIATCFWHRRKQSWTLRLAVASPHTDLVGGRQLEIGLFC